jgi:hypothetical protein
MDFRANWGAILRAPPNTDLALHPWVLDKYTGSYGYLAKIFCLNPNTNDKAEPYGFFFCFLFGSLIPRMYTLYQPVIFWVFCDFIP